ncbi:MAG: type II toxin-antitoxin system RelE/ParE family toxin [Chloroflexi bacterium]|nr:MAG: type II toxin-antitoxin system RelE/ParE family toxin [Chloroflexota bacterium]HDN80256.1 type II toxin-antitoxin system RelE/ParE family toxin [Chloroflexota bacterium]
MYKVEAPSTRIKRELRRIPPRERQRVIKAIEALKENPRPHGIVQLEPNVYRLRVGDYRVIYKVFDEEKLVLIGRVVRRSEKTYRGVKELFG